MAPRPTLYRIPREPSGTFPRHRSESPFQESRLEAIRTRDGSKATPSLGDAGTRRLKPQHRPFDCLIAIICAPPGRSRNPGGPQHGDGHRELRERCGPIRLQNHVPDQLGASGTLKVFTKRRCLAASVQEFLFPSRPAATTGRAAAGQRTSTR